MLLCWYQISLETQIRKSDFIFDYVNLLYYLCYKINFKRGDSYTDSPDCIEKKKATTNPKNDDDDDDDDDDKRFQYATAITLNFEEIKKDPQIDPKPIHK